MKYKLTNNTIEYDGRTLYQIECVTPFDDIKKGQLGGWIEKEDNLSQNGTCWVSGNAMVFGNAKVYDNTLVSGNAKVYDYALVFGNALVYGNARVWCNARVYDYAVVYDNARVFGNARVCGNAEIQGNAEVSSMKDYIVFKNWWSSGRHFTWTRSNNKWKVGCFYGSGTSLIAKAYKDSEECGREYENIVKYVENVVLNSKKFQKHLVVSKIIRTFAPRNQ